ncbi:hypothetical protein H4Q26_017886 [Puccinia striiformis f. sp. tritici PST-130]|nr:hypothetical protein H4Q26_017886 [Puccinia striiformis f. sp. tritici PST-130]
MPGPNQVKWGNGSHYCVITLTAESTPSPAEDTSSSPSIPATTSEPLDWDRGMGFSSSSFAKSSSDSLQSCRLPIITMPGPNQVKWGNGSHYCVITLTAESTPSPAEATSSSPSTPTTSI